MKSQEMAQDITASLRARNPMLWVVTREEGRVEPYLFEAGATVDYEPVFWDVAAGFTSLNGKPLSTYDNAVGDPDAALDAINNSTKRRLWIMRDLPAWLNPPVGLLTLRRLRNLARSLPGRDSDQAQAVIIISPTKDVPAELADDTTVYEWPLPDREEIAAILDVTIEDLPDAMINGSRDAAIDAAVGLSGEQAQATFARSLVQTKRIDPAVIAAEKKRVVAKAGGAEWFDPIEGGLKALGGLDNLKSWLVSRASAYSPAAREYGLPAPKGAILVGVPGCGKSLACKTIGTEWKIPVIRIDLAALKGKYVGESEANLRNTFSMIEAIGRCVVWVDEIEKALAGSTDGSADGGVSADALGFLLSWMQERQGEAFVIATANNAEKLPPELLRKGRFDEVWWVDLPNHVERESIIAAALRTNKRDASKIDFATVADATDSFTGAELAALVPDAMFAAFNDGAREVTTDDLLLAAKVVVPLAKTASEKIGKLREYWAGRARPATAAIVEAPRKGAKARVLDLN
jgi:AAA+ superfamily predicted ATPase